MIKLWCSDGSPFARKVRIVLLEKRLEHELDMRSGLRPVETHRNLNPALAVPVLQDGDLVLFESNLILDYLFKTYPKVPPDAPHPPLFGGMTREAHHWSDSKTLAVIESLLGAIANLKLMRDSGATPERVPYLGRQRERIESCLDHLEATATPDGFAPGWFSAMDINLICAVAYGERRAVMTLGDRPRLQSLITCHATRPSVAATRPHDLQTGGSG